MKKQFQVDLFKVSFGCYLVLVFVLMPLLAPLRALEIFDPGYLRNALLPPVLAFIILSAGFRALVPNNIFQLVLGLVFIQAFVLGIPKVLDEGGVRNFLSHLFQIVSAYCIFGVGMVASNRLHKRYWRKFVLLGLFSIVISTVATVVAYGRGDIGRLYTPVYGLVLISSYAALYSKRQSLVVFLGLLVSNKRGPIISILLMYFQAFIKNDAGAKKSKRPMYFFAGLFCMIFLGVVVSTQADKLSDYSHSSNAFIKSVGATYARLEAMFDFDNEERSIDEMSSGRMEEIELALMSLEPIDYVFGSGAGWEIELPNTKAIHNIHFTPLSLSAVFGVPFTCFVYLYLLYIVFQSYRLSPDEIMISQKMGRLYLTGAIFHSLIAYSLFIDLLVFFFAGSLVTLNKMSRA